MSSLWRLFLLFLKTGNLTFGGGDPTMAVLQRELVTLRRWLPPESYGLIYGLARITPGTNLLAFCAGVGWELRRWLGAIAAVAAVGGPGAVVVVWFTLGYESWRSNPAAMAAIGGTLAAAVGMMAGGAMLLVRPHLRRGRWLRAMTLAAGAIIVTTTLRLSPVQVLAVAAAAGAAWRTE